MKSTGMREQTLQEWHEEGKKLFGEDFKQWKFKCPACGHVQTIQDFLDVEADGNSAYQECIGRHTGKGSAVKGDTSGCNWAAYGLFRTLGNGRMVITPEGKKIEVFNFSEEDK